MKPVNSGSIFDFVKFIDEIQPTKEAEIQNIKCIDDLCGTLFISDTKIKVLKVIESAQMIINDLKSKEESYPSYCKAIIKKAKSLIKDANNKLAELHV